MQSLKQIAAALFLLFGFVQVGHATDLKVVLLDSKTGNAMHSKMICVVFPSTEPIVANQARMCSRTDGTGTATFRLPDTDPQTVKVELNSNNLEPCFKPGAYSLAEAFKDGLVATNTCADETTTTKNPGELVLYGHQKSVKEALGQARDEW
jgi:hypothetical protein